MRTYTPKRSSARWLDGAPAEVLACYDSGPRVADRYTVLFGGRLYDPAWGRNVLALGMSEYPSHPQGIGQTLELPAGDRAGLGRKVKWADLPLDVQTCCVRFIND